MQFPFLLLSPFAQCVGDDKLSQQLISPGDQIT
jgi:hypothetical protein